MIEAVLRWYRAYCWKRFIAARRQYTLQYQIRQANVLEWNGFENFKVFRTSYFPHYVVVAKRADGYSSYFRPIGKFLTADGAMNAMERERQHDLQARATLRAKRRKWLSDLKSTAVGEETRQ